MREMIETICKKCSREWNVPKTEWMEPGLTCVCDGGYLVLKGSSLDKNHEVEP